MPTHAHADLVARNRAYWEDLAPHRKGKPVEFFQRGGSALTAHEIEAVGDLVGRRVLQLACSVGDEALTFAALGAAVTAVDISPTHLATGRDKASELGLAVEFLERDMNALDDDFGEFDIIYISWGGICWVPDLTDWMDRIARLLVLGGHLVISEHHPLWEILTVQDDATLSISGDYFGARRDGYADPMKAPQVTRELGQPDLPHSSFVWSIGAVITAVLDAGLGVTSFQEFPEPDMYAGLGLSAQSIPATYLLTAGSSRPTA